MFLWIDRHVGRPILGRVIGLWKALNDHKSILKLKRPLLDSIRNLNGCLISLSQRPTLQRVVLRYCSYPRETAT